MSMDRKVIYHANCNDGFCAAWVFHRNLGETAEYLPMHYGQAAPNVTGAKVYIADFSFPRDVLLKMAAEAEFVVLLDHHKTAQADLEGLSAPRLSIIFDMAKSGARLSTEYAFFAFPGDQVGAGWWLVEYTEDRDLWRWALPHSREINAALSTYPLEFAVWDQLAKRQPEDLIEEGRAVLRYQEKIVEQAARNATTWNIAGYDVPVVNSTVLFSDIAGKLAETAPFGVCYFDRQDGKRQFSLRSRGEDAVDVSEVAKRYGGGGHRNAAGFEMAIVPCKVF